MPHRSEATIEEAMHTVMGALGVAPEDWTVRDLQGWKKMDYDWRYEARYRLQGRSFVRAFVHKVTEEPRDAYPWYYVVFDNSVPTVVASGNVATADEAMGAVMDAGEETLRRIADVVEDDRDGDV